MRVLKRLITADARAWTIAALLTLLLAGDVICESEAAQVATHAIAVDATAIAFDRLHPDATTFGRLTWRGGLELEAPSTPEFGGYSGIAVTDGGRRFIAISDEGSWLEGDLVYRRDTLAGVDNARIGPLLSKKGKLLKKKRDADAEDICIVHRKKGDYALISFERKHRIGRFPFEDGGLGAPVSYLDLPEELSEVDPNKGLESVTVLTDDDNRGTVLTFAEEKLDDEGNHTGWLIRDSSSAALRLKRHGGFDITSLTTLPNGNVVVLERSFSLLSGVGMRLSEIDHRDIRPGALLDGREILQADMRYEIDNMEGVSASENEAGETILTLVSDDNFNRNGLQRTLLMQFRLD
jgi:hypothetical protein